MVPHPLRQPCSYHLRGTCTRPLCDYWHLPECQFYITESGCKAGDKCLFLHHKVDGQPSKKPKKGCDSHRRESDDKNAVAIVKIAPQLGCVSQDSDALVSQRGKQSLERPDAKSLGIYLFEKYGSVSLRYVKQVSGKRKGPSLGKIQVKNPHQRSRHAVKFEDRPEKRLTDNSDTPEARHGTLPKTFTGSKKRHRFILLVRGRSLW